MEIVCFGAERRPAYEPARRSRYQAPDHLAVLSCHGRIRKTDLSGWPCPQPWAGFIAMPMPYSWLISGEAYTAASKRILKFLPLMLPLLKRENAVFAICRCNAT